MAYSNIWDATQPPDTQAADLLGQDIRNFKVDVQERLGTFFSGPLANRPTPEAAWAGLLFFSTDTNQIFRWGGAAWVEIKVGTKIFKNTTQVVQVSPAGAVDGISVAVPGNTLVAGDIVTIKAGVRCIQASAAPTSIALVLLATAQSTSLVLNSDGIVWEWELSVLSAATQLLYMKIWGPNGTFGIHPVQALALDLTQALTFKTRTAGNGDGTFSHDFIKVEIS